MNVALVLGVGVVMPLAFKARFTPSHFTASHFTAWQVAAVGVAASLSVPAGLPAALALSPWVLLAIVEGVTALRRRVLVNAILAGFAGTASLALVASRLELTLFDIREPIVKLTAMHFTYAGVGALALAARVVEQSPTRWRRRAGLLLMVAPPFTALGFITRLAFFQVGGAVLMTVGVLFVAVVTFVEGARREGSVRWLLFVSAAAPWVAMGLALLWAANQYWPQVPALSVPEMVPTHGALNAFGFVLCGLLGFFLVERRGS